ncbi:MAG: RING finger protein [Candidatus Hodarchaeota archaeon]
MTSQGNSHTGLQKKWLDRVPLIWKRKVNNIIKKDQHNALEIFFDSFRQGKDQKQMKYGLEQLLPESIYLILNSFEGFSQKEAADFLDLLASPEFLNEIPTLDIKNQELILSQIYENWNSGLLNKESTIKLIQKLNSTLIEKLYDTILKEKSISAVEIVKLWGIDVLPKTLQLFLKSPTKSIEVVFKEINPKQKIDILFTVDNSIYASKTQFKILMRLMTATEDEISYLMSIQPFLSKENRIILINWLIENKISQELILGVYQQNYPDKNFQFIIQYFMGGINSKIYQPPELLILLLVSKEFRIAHEILILINEEKSHNIAEILIYTLEKLQDQLFQYLTFFQTELQTYSSQKIDLILEAYLNSPYDSLHSLLLPILQGSATKNWRLFLKTIVETKASPSSHLVTNIFIRCSKKTKLNLGNYIIKESWISRLSFLFDDFDIFQSALVYPKKISISDQILLESSLKQNVTKQLKEIVLLGNKITYPKLAFASIMDNKSLSILITTIEMSNRRKLLLEYWEEVFLACADDALFIVLKKYSITTKREKKYLVPLLKKLISLELTQFWKIFRGLSTENFQNLLPILPHTFEESIPNLGNILSYLPESHYTFLLKKILPDFVSSSGSKILYSLFSIEDLKYVNEGVLQDSIYELIKLDKDLLIIVLIRCSKTISDPKLENFVSRLSFDIFSKYPENSLKIIDTNNLTSLIPQVRAFFTTLKDDRITELFLSLIPTLESKVFSPFIIDYFLNKLVMQDSISLLEKVLSDYERRDYSSEGKNVLKELIKNLVGKSITFDLLIFATFNQKPKSQSLLLQIYLSRVSRSTVEKLILDPNMEISEEKTIDAIVEHFKTYPPEDPERYFFDLYRTIKKDSARQTLLPLLGEYCSWTNLSILMELPEKSNPKYKKTYQKALTNFAKKYNIHSSRALLEIWKSGLKDVYTQKIQETALWQSNCPQCDHPILENQKNCGFCTQRLTCVICFKSVVKPKGIDIVKCPQCSNFFHRHHLLESIKLQSRCPVCNVKLTEPEVTSLPSFRFHFQ